MQSVLRWRLVSQGVAMKVFKLRTSILAIFTALMAAWVLAPTAAAQQTTLDLALSGSLSNLVPESQPGTLKATVTYGYTNQAFAGSTAAASSVTITFTPNCPPSILVTGPTTKILPLQPQTTVSSGQGSTTADFFVTATREAPGLKSIQCTMTVSASPQTTGVTAPPDASQAFVVSADYYALIQPKITKKLQQAGPQKQVPFAIELSNFGNARTQISFELGSKPSGKRWDVLLPDNLILDSPYSGGEGKTVDTATVTVATPYKNGWNNEQGAYQITMKPSSADQPDKQGNPISANVLVRVRGVYVPGLEPFVMIAAILGSALVLRLRRE